MQSSLTPYLLCYIFDMQQNYGNPPGRSELTAATNGQWTMASNRGPNAVGAAPQFAHSAGALGAGAGSGSTSGIAAANLGVGGSWGAGGAAPSASGMGLCGGAAVGGGMATAAAPVAPSPAMGTGTAGASASDGSYERNLVMELCPPGGMKAEPPLEKLVAFLRAIPSLDADLVCPVLLDCLEDGQPWIIKAKALCVIEKTIVTAEEQRLDAYSAFFHACAEEIQPLAVHNRSAIHNPARRVLKALGLDAAYGTAGGAAPPVRAQKAAAAAPVVAEAPNLLDFDEPAAAAAPAPASAAPVPDMLGGDVPAAAAAPAAPAPAPAAGGDMFGGLTTKDKAVPAPAAVASAPAVANGGGDLFGDMQVKPSTSTETPVENGTAAPASGGSAFGFMNATANGSAPAPAPEAPTAAATPAPPAPAPAAPAAAAPKPGDAGFDPLLSLSAPTEPTAEEKVAKTQAQIAQMQAMQYQQQMMMMQQQMAQMQMAMAGGGVPQSPRPATHAAAGASAGVNANVMSAHSSTATTGFSFLDNASGAAQEAQKKKNAAFDFVMDDMKKG